MIGVLIGDVSFDFSLELMKGMSDAAIEANVHVMFFLGMQQHGTRIERNTASDSTLSHNSVYDYAALAGVDSFVFACGSLSGFSGDGLYRQFLGRFSHKPYVVLQERIALDTPKHTYIVVDNYNSFTQCMEHLIVDHGYRKIGYVSGPKGHSDAKQRLHAYLDAMAKHGLTVEPNMIIYGSFYEFVDDQVAMLMDQHPDLDAIAFANDEMAKAGYRECRRRGLVIGRDIAITGFDNFSSATHMLPPLTTVSQSAYRMGRLAIDYATQLTDGITVKALEMKTEFIRRQSCGCAQDSFCYRPAMEGEDALAFIDNAIDIIMKDYASQFPTDEQETQVEALRICLDGLRSLSLDTSEEEINYNILFRHFEFFIQHSPPLLSPLTYSLKDYLLRVFCAERLPLSVRKFSSAVTQMQQYLHTREVHALELRYDKMQSETWIAPELTRGLYGQTNDQEVLRCVTERLMMAGLKHIYICLLEEPQRYGSGGLDNIPNKLLLAAKGNDGAIEAYSRERMPVIDDLHPFSSLHDYTLAPSMMAFSFFSGENQYGILICETDGSKSALLHVIGLQLGMMIDFLELRRKEKTIAIELENIREKNEILNFLSEYDELCGLLNRRGFIARAIRKNRENIGKTAFCMFIDLDYLKQINDTFGHTEGDSALRAVSVILQDCVGESEVLGRIGGDEFVGLIVNPDRNYGEILAQKILAACSAYNDSVQKPYLLDVSIGMKRFTCRQGLEVSSIIAEADKRLYEAKRKRKTLSLRLRKNTSV